MDPSSAKYLKDNLTKKEKSCVEDGLGKEHQMVSLRRDKGALQHFKQNKQHCTKTEWKMSKGNKRNTTGKEPKEVVKTTTVTKQTQPGKGRPQQSP